MLHFAYSIFYIKPQIISVVKCNDIALNSCAVLLSFFVIDGMEAMPKMSTVFFPLKMSTAEY
jgi:hypothetical protein